MNFVYRRSLVPCMPRLACHGSHLRVLPLYNLTTARDPRSGCRQTGGIYGCRVRLSVPIFKPQKLSRTFLPGTITWNLYDHVRLARKTNYRAGVRVVFVQDKNTHQRVIKGEIVHSIKHLAGIRLSVRLGETTFEGIVGLGCVGGSGIGTFRRRYVTPAWWITGR